jgi:hypothetical protein
MWEMNLLLASLRRVEVRIEPQTIADFLKWKNRLVEYNGGLLPEGVESSETNLYLANSGSPRRREDAEKARTQMVG